MKRFIALGALLIAGWVFAQAVSPGASNVSGVTGTTPVSVSNGSTAPVVSMTAADAGVEGYVTITAQDWTGDKRDFGAFTANSLTAGSGFLRLSPTALPTCAIGTIDTFRNDNTSGGLSGHKTRICLCTIDGSDAGSTFAWQNVISGTVGNTTTCSD